MTVAYDQNRLLNLKMYPFSDGATRKARDFSGYGYHGSENGFVGDDSEYRNDGIRQVVDLNIKFFDCGGASFFGLIGNITLECLFSCPLTQPYAGLIGKYNDGVSGANRSYRLGVFNTGLVQVNFGTGTTALSTVTTVDNRNYNYAVATYDGAAVRLYLNGSPNASVASSGNLFVNSHTLYVGSDGDGATGNRMIGSIAQAGVFSRVLGAAEIYDRCIKIMNGLL